MKSGCIQLPRWLRETWGVFREFASALFWCALGVILLTFVALGFTTALGLSGKEALELYTPLLLGLFSIGITLYLFQRNVREGRVRARKDRDDAVRPILIMQGWKRSQGEGGKQRQCFATKPSPDGSLTLSVENAGLGTALDTEMYVTGTDSRLYRIYPDTHKLAPNEEIKLILSYALPVRIAYLLTRYEDVYGNTHFSEHGIDQDETGILQVFANRYVKDWKTFKQHLEAVAYLPPLSREAYVAGEIFDRIEQQN